MATRRLRTLIRHMSAGGGGASMTSPGASAMSKMRCKNGVEIATKAWGPPSSKIRTLAIHGFLDNAGTFDLLGPALAKEGIRVVAMDLPGHGRSGPMSKDAWYQILDFPEYVIEVARSLGWDRFSLVGHSLGGAVASLVAGSFPELVERCVFVDILGPYAFTPGTSPWRLRKSIDARQTLVDKEPKTYASFDEAVNQRLKAVTHWGAGQTMSWNGAARLVAGGSKSPGDDGRVIFTHDARLRAASPMYLTEDSVLSYLREIRCPCLMARGANGMVSDTPTYLGRKAALGGRLRDIILPGSHHLHLDDDTAPLVAARVSDFLLDRERASAQEEVPISTEERGSSLGSQL